MFESSSPPPKERKKTTRWCGIGIVYSYASASLKLCLRLGGNANPAPRIGSALRFESSIPLPKERKNDHRVMVVFLWQGNRDSNPNIQSQSLLCCRYTIPLYLVDGYYFSIMILICQEGFAIFLANSADLSAGGGVSEHRHVYVCEKSRWKFHPIWSVYG